MYPKQTNACLKSTIKTLDLRRFYDFLVNFDLFSTLFWCCCFFCCWIWTGIDFGIITWCQAKPIIWFFSKSDELNCFCGMVDQRKTFSLISSRDHCQKSSPWTWVQNLSAEPQFRLSWMKLCSSDNHYTI